jgi:hypothetical protein
MGWVGSGRLGGALALAALALSLSSCGGGGATQSNAVAQVGVALPGGDVAQVADAPITKATFDHWMSVDAGTRQTHMVPEPPDYSTCISHMAVVLKPAKGQKAPATAELKYACERQYESLKSEVMEFLISSQWEIGEASALGVTVSEQEVQQALAKQYPKASEKQRYLQSSGQTISDVLARLEGNLLEQKIRQTVIDKAKVSPTPAQITAYYNERKSSFGRLPLSKLHSTIKQQLIAIAEQARISEFVKEFTTKWKAKTDCATGYVVEDCKQYKEPPPSQQTAENSQGLAKPRAERASNARGRPAKFTPPPPRPEVRPSRAKTPASGPALGVTSSHSVAVTVPGASKAPPKQGKVLPNGTITLVREQLPAPTQGTVAIVAKRYKSKGHTNLDLSAEYRSPSGSGTGSEFNVEEGVESKSSPFSFSEKPVGCGPPVTLIWGLLRSDPATVLLRSGNKYRALTRVTIPESLHAGGELGYGIATSATTLIVPNPSGGSDETKLEIPPAHPC